MAEVQEDEVVISIPWRSWGRDAFQEARDRDLPILLSISAVWCHWCHVMDTSTYHDPEVIRRVSSELVPIRVDVDRRPDINNRYNLGGWPTTAFLTPEGDLLTGGTYLPVEEFLDLLNQVNSFCREQRTNLEQRLERRRARRTRISELRHRLRGDVTPETIDTVVDALTKAYDAENGGFGGAPKFPLPDTIELALALGQTRPDQMLLNIARTTLTNMAQGGIYDQVAGGFFRYATMADWSEPHYEKMLDGNARLLAEYLHAAQAFDQPLFWETARGIITFADDTLRSAETGAYGGSVDADEEYYHLLADARTLRNPPAVDPTLYTDRNAMMVSSLLEAAVVLDEPYLADEALETLEAIWSRCFEPGSGLAHSWDGSPYRAGLLADQVWVGRALLDAQAYVGHGDYLARAENLMGIMAARLQDPDAGGYYDVPFEPDALGRLQERLKLLDENSLAADMALRLYRLTGKDSYYEAAVSTLEVMAPLYRTYRHHAASYALAVYRFTRAPLHLIVVGDPIAEASRTLRQAALSIYDPNRLVETVDPALAQARLQQLGLPAEPAPALYVRRGTQTLPPIQDPAQVRAAVEAVPA